MFRFYFWQFKIHLRAEDHSYNWISLQAVSSYKQWLQLWLTFMKKIDVPVTSKFVVMLCCYVSGVNMFAMLTGNLPFTVQPFTIKALYAKMIAGDMNTLPDYLTNSTLSSSSSSSPSSSSSSYLQQSLTDLPLCCAHFSAK